MSRAVNLGNAAASGDEQQLSPRQIEATLNRRIRRFRPCLRLDRSLRSVTMNLAIAGSGTILGVTVLEGSPTFRQCIATRARSIRMPRFRAPRLGTSFQFAW